MNIRAKKNKSGLAAALALTALVTISTPLSAWASRSQDLQDQIANLSEEARQYDNAGRNAESNGDKAEACALYRKAAQKWRDAASAGTSLIIETLNDSNLDPDAVNENVHIMGENAQADDNLADAVCS